MVFQEQRGSGCSCRPPRQEGQVVRGAGGLHADPGQVGIEAQVKPGGSSFQVTQQQVLHGIKTDGAQPEGVLHGVVDFLVDFLVGEISRSRSTCTNSRLPLRPILDFQQDDLMMALARRIVSGDEEDEAETGGRSR